MYIQMTPWAVAILIQTILIAFGSAIYFYMRVAGVRAETRAQLDRARRSVMEAEEEVIRVKEEAMRKRTIVTFDPEDMEGLIASGEMAGDPDIFEDLKAKLVESAEVLGQMGSSAADLNGVLAEVMEKQMEAVNMVGRLGGTGGLPPELKEKAEAILDVFRTLDETLSGAYEEMDKLESGVGEVSAAIADFRDADPKVKLPTHEVLNVTLKKKAGVDLTEEEQALLAAPSAEAEEDGDQPPMDAFDADKTEEARA